jgi:hypothetical protein
MIILFRKSIDAHPRGGWRLLGLHSGLLGLAGKYGNGRVGVVSSVMGL